MSHMGTEARQVHVRLMEWGKWTHEHLHAWPQRTTLARVIEEGPAAPHASGGPIQMPQRVANVDIAVARCPKIDQRALRRYYGLYDEPFEAVARSLNLGKRQAENVLSRARWRVWGYLLAIES